MFVMGFIGLLFAISGLTLLGYGEKTFLIFSTLPNFWSVSAHLVMFGIIFFMSSLMIRHALNMDR